MATNHQPDHDRSVFDPRDAMVKEFFSIIRSSEHSCVTEVRRKPESLVVNHHHVGHDQPCSGTSERQQRHGPNPLPRILWRLQHSEPGDIRLLRQLLWNWVRCEGHRSATRFLCIDQRRQSCTRVRLNIQTEFDSRFQLAAHTVGEPWVGRSLAVRICAETSGISFAWLGTSATCPRPLVARDR